MAASDSTKATEDRMTCGRRGESFRSLELGQDFWDDDGTCSYCGSLRPEVLLDRIDAGDITITATDKSYKIYVAGDGFFQKCKVEAKYVNGMRESRGEMYRSHDDWTPYVVSEPDSAGYVWVKRPMPTHNKFYFQHFYDYSDGEGVLIREFVERFMKAWRENRIKWEGGIAFYRKPMFLA